MSKEARKTARSGGAERVAVRELVRAARATGGDLTGPDGLFKPITKQVLESALEEEMTEHLGHRSTPPQSRAAATSAMAPDPRRS